MKNITVSVDDSLYHRARVRAAEMQTTVSGLVREFLVGIVADEAEPANRPRALAEIIASIRAEHPGFSAFGRLPRDTAHERRAVR